jgi:hypothetical protein
MGDMKSVRRVRVYEQFLVVEGSGRFPLDMLRYDSAFPHEEADTAAIEHDERRRRVVLCRRSVNESAGTPDRWASFGWKVIGAFREASFAHVAVAELIAHQLAEADALGSGL